MKKNLFQLLAIGLIFLIGCQKEVSFETSGNPSKGSLQADASGDCLPKTVNGVYVATTPLVPTSNTITVQVTVATTGSYEVYTDTVNGMYFRATGTFTTVGANTVTLRGNGTPFAQGTYNFVVAYDSTFCDVQVDVLPAGSGGPAVFTLVSGGTPVNCASAVVSGAYIKDVALGVTNYVDISVDVTTIGTYNLRATGGNMIFIKTGAFLTTGPQVVRLQGSGTPNTPGANTITFDAPFASCSFTVTVTASGAATLGGAGGACTPSTVNGTYTALVPLTGTNTVTIQVNVTTAGAFNISTNTVDGFSFSFAGSLAAGTQNVTLNGTGTPGSAGAKNFVVTLAGQTPAQTCNFTVTVVAGAGAGVGTLGGAGGACTPSTVNGTYTVLVALTGANTVTIQVTVTTAGTFNISTNTVDGFSFSFAGSLALGAQNVTLNGTGTPGSAGAKNFTVTMAGQTPAQTCTFTVTVVSGGGGAVFTVDCSSAIVNGFYEQNSQLNPCNTVDIDVNVTTIGNYTITTTPTSGMTFSKTGNFAATGITTITLQGTGTPNANGLINIPVPAPSSCTFPVIVDPESPPYHWNFTMSTVPAASHRGQDDGSTMTPAPPGVIFQLDGSNSIGSDALQIILIDINGTIANGETYSTSTTTSNAAAFTYFPECSFDPYQADPSISGVSMTFTVTSHNTTTKIITGTFTGTAKNSAGQTVTITAGTFTGDYN
jgi:hypothetical protein